MFNQITDTIRQLKKAKDTQDTIRRLLKSADGQAVLRHLLRTYVITPTFQADPRAAAFAEGRRALILQLGKTAYGKDTFSDLIRQEMEENDEVPTAE